MRLDGLDLPVDFSVPFLMGKVAAEASLQLRRSEVNGVGKRILEDELPEIL